MKANVHTTAIPAEVIEQARTKMQELHDLLNPHLSIALTAQDRRRLPKMGVKALDFVGTAFDAAREFPKMLPGHASIEDFEVDYADARQLHTLHTALETTLQRISDQMMVSGSEAYQFSLMVYQSVKMANDQKIPDAKVLYEKMKGKFPGAQRRAASKKADTDEA